MDIQLFAGDKEIIAPLFDFKLDEKDNVLILGITSFDSHQQNLFLNELKYINDDNFILNSNYIAFVTANKIYFFDLSLYSEHKIENLLILGQHDFMFGFLDGNQNIINNTYVVMKLTNYKLKEL